MSSPPPAHVPYQAYKSKRHSRTPSNQFLVPNMSPPPTSRPPSIGSPRAVIPAPDFTPEEKLDLGPPHPNIVPLKLDPDMAPIPANGSVNGNGVHISDDASDVPQPTSPTVAITEAAPVEVQAPVPVSGQVSTLVNDTHADAQESAAGPSSPSPSETKPLPAVRKSSTFRHIPLRAPARSPMPSSPLRPSNSHTRTLSTSSNASRNLEPSQGKRPAEPRARVTSRSSSTIGTPTERPLPTIPSFERLEKDAPLERSQSVDASAQPAPHFIPPTRTHSLMGPPRPPVKTPSPSATPHPSAPPTPNNTHSPLPAPSPRPSAPYRPGFQPKGVYRPRTDEFVEACRAKRDVGRIEHTKLERRLEKLINLHFSSDEKRAVELGRPAANRRASSFFDMDFSDLKSMDAGELWRGVLQSPALQGSKADIRAAEQRITPWQDDSTVTKCPLCTASFHPLTNRKHHCRLCGQIICSLPVKRPQRPVPCSILFVVDPRTRRIEEVGEGVDYGVRKRRSTPPQPAKGKAKDDALGDEEKFLKGVRICNQCRPVLLRQQYQHETVHVPTFAKLYDAFIKLEHEIEESLPQFQELIVSLSHDDQPTKEASAARKRILEAFAQYDALSKRIRRLPCPSGPGSSQDRVQMAIVTRASIFLQKNMFPLQSLPKSKSKTTPAASPDDAGAPLIDPDSELAHTLQPLLEQEALLESFVEEAKAHRKFEDAKTLKTNLAEIRTEIDRIMANAEGGMTRGNGSARK